MTEFKKVGIKNSFLKKMITTLSKKNDDLQKENDDLKIKSMSWKKKVKENTSSNDFSKEK